ncbi:MAG: type 4 prepilin peptidase 1 [Bryobacterales bacterium]|nr:type 4 prepilin peptidase 1 [Bryobacterales bacterium]
MLEAILAFLAGLLIGSFLNVCVFRLPRDLSVVRPRSFCPACEKPIAWYDNIPVASYLMLGGRCRHCKARIPLRYLMVELGTGAAFAICVVALGPTLAGLKYAVFSAILITLFATDLEERILPDEFTLGGTVVGVVFAAVVPIESGILTYFLSGAFGLRMASVAEALVSAWLAGGSIWLVGWLYEKIRHREGMGFGDVKMIAMIGSFLGFQETLLTLILASVLGSVAGVAYVLITKKDMSTYELPFGSFIGLAGLVVALWGHVVRPWYFGGAG